MTFECIEFDLTFENTSFQPPKKNGIISNVSSTPFKTSNINAFRV